MKTISCSDSAVGADFEVGETYYVRCDESSCGGSVWGCPRNNGWVTADSKICKVATMLSIPVGSLFTLVRAAGQTSYQPCTMNGITTGSYGNFGGSFRIFGKQERISIPAKTLSILYAKETLEIISQTFNLSTKFAI